MPERPNIIFVFSDQHNAFTGSMGVGSAPRTPHLDSLRSQGADFSQAYCNAPICVPSRMSFLSARQPSAVGAYNNDDRLSPMEPTFVHGLSAAGYRTVLCGKMHFLDPDFFHGFQENLLGEPGLPLFEDFCGESGQPLNWHTTGWRPVVFSGAGSQGFQFYDRQVARCAAETIRSHSGSPTPLFLLAGFILPHNPYVCDPEKFAHHYDRIDPEKLKTRLEKPSAHDPYLSRHRTVNQLDHLPLDVHRRALAAYFGLCEELDENLGTILNAVRESPAADRTVVVYSSDHGDLAARHGLWYKSSLVEDSIRVPLVIQGPDIPAGPRHRVVGLTDLAVTLCHLAGAQPPPEASGKSFAPALSDPTDADPGTVVCESVGRDRGGPLWMRRHGPWKYTYCHQPRLEILCNLETDPQETQNRLHDPACAGLLAGFRKARRAAWNPARVAREWVTRKTQRSYLEAAGRITVPPPPSEMACPPGWNQFEPSQVSEEERKLL